MLNVGKKLLSLDSNHLKINNLKNVSLLIILVFLSFSSCSTEENLDFIIKQAEEQLEEEDTVEEPTDEESTDEEPTEEETDEPEDPPVESETPCEYDASSFTAGSLNSINCVLDLGGASINLPTDVSFDYDGGKIINGTLVFTGGYIDGNLLNSSLNVEGDAVLKDRSSFKFEKERWDITEGEITKDVAIVNKANFQKAIDLTKRLGAEKFEVGEMDAFFSVGLFGTPRDLSEDAIHLPSDFHFAMGENTILRVQPNDLPFSILLAVYAQSNTLITGGKLYGDRWEHDYKIIERRSSHEWPVLLQVSGSEDITIQNVYMANSTGDAFVAGNPNEYRYNGSRYNQRVKLINCTTHASRRNNISITDGDDTLIEGCIITDAGIGEQPKGPDGNTTQFTSAGVLPRTGIDIEPFLGGNDDGSITYFARVQRTTIRGCTFSGNSNTSLIDYSGEDSIIENNTSDGGFSAHYGWRTKFRNNTFVATEDTKNDVAITTGYTSTIVGTLNTPDTQEQAEKGYEISGNNIRGFRTGIETFGKDGIVSNNYITDCGFGIQPKQSDNFYFFNNEIVGTNMVGITALGGIGNMTFKNNYIDVNRSPITWQTTNNTTDSSTKTILFQDNKFIAKETGYYAFFKESPNITAINNTITNASLLVVDCPNFVDQDNTDN